MTTQDTQVMKMKLLQSKSCYTLRSYVYFEKSRLDFSVHGDLLRTGFFQSLINFLHFGEVIFFQPLQNVLLY